MPKSRSEVIKLQQRFRVVLIGFVGLLLVVVGFVCLSLFKPVESATSPGTCLPVDKGGTGCDTLPISLGGTGGTTPLDARANLGFATLSATQNITTDMSNLQATINSLPKYLANNVTINVTAGTFAGNIMIERFVGPGTLVVRAVDGGGTPLVSAGTTHNANRFQIYNNSSTGTLVLSGFNATIASNNSFEVIGNSNLVAINYDRAVGGASSDGSNYGIFSQQSPGGLIINGGEYSNKFFAVMAADQTTVIPNGLTGTGNHIVYRAQLGGVLSVRTIGTITGTSLWSTVQSGVIFDDNGNQRGNGVETQNLIGAGATFNFDRKGSTVQVHIASDLASATTANELLFTTSVGIRPARNSQLQLRAGNGTSYRFLWNTDGTFYSTSAIPSGTQLRDAVTLLAAD